jgi:hypothetical protein
LNIAARLHIGATGAVADWQELLGPEATVARTSRVVESIDGVVVNDSGDVPLPIAQQRGWEQAGLARLLSNWLILGNVRPRLDWGNEYDPDPPPSVRFSGGTLFGELAMRLAMSVSQSRGLAVCSGCGTAYPPRRRPSLGRRNYCLACRRARVPQRDAEAAYRLSKRAGHRRRSHGKKTR